MSKKQVGWTDYESGNNPQFPSKGMCVRVFKERMPEPDKTNENRRIVKVYDLTNQQHIALSIWLSQLRPIADALADSKPEAKWVDGVFVPMAEGSNKIQFQASKTLDSA